MSPRNVALQMPNYILTFRLEPWPSTAEEELETSVDWSKQTTLYQQLTLEEAQAETKDDRLVISLAATDDRAAVERGINLANRFCMFLSLYQAQYFKVRLSTALNSLKAETPAWAEVYLSNRYAFTRSRSLEKASVWRQLGSR
jgi:hypothetical protein